MKAKQIFLGLIGCLIVVILKTTLIFIVSFYSITLSFWIDGCISGVAGTLLILILLYLKKEKRKNKLKQRGTDVKNNDSQSVPTNELILTKEEKDLIKIIK